MINCFNILCFDQRKQNTVKQYAVGGRGWCMIIVWFINNIDLSSLGIRHYIIFESKYSKFQWQVGIKTTTGSLNAFDKSWSLKFCFKNVIFSYNHNTALNIDLNVCYKNDWYDKSTALPEVLRDHNSYYGFFFYFKAIDSQYKTKIIINAQVHASEKRSIFTNLYSLHPINTIYNWFLRAL